MVISLAPDPRSHWSNRTEISITPDLQHSVQGVTLLLLLCYNKQKIYISLKSQNHEIKEVLLLSLLGLDFIQRAI